MTARAGTPVLPFDASDWRVGKRVTRPDGNDSGTIVEDTDQIKVKRDSGRTSYFTPGMASNVLLKPLTGE
jgi:hypothetical protein